MDGLNSDLDLNGAAPASVRPTLGALGPENVPTTRAKRRQRWWVVLWLVLAVAAVVAFGWWVYSAMQGA